MQIVLATGNKGKINEFKRLMPNDEVIAFSEILGDMEIIEDANTFQGNAIIKAETIYEKLNDENVIVISDDSGITVPVLNNEPGIYSARYAGEGATDKDNLNKLIDNLNNRPSISQKSDDIMQSFVLAKKLGSIDSAIISWQRVAENFETLPWYSLFEKEILTSPNEWQEAQHFIISFPSIRLEELIALKLRLPKFWKIAISSKEYRLAMGNRIRNISLDSESYSSENMNELIIWLQEIILDIKNKDNVLLSSAFYLSPNKFISQLIDYISSSRSSYSTGHVISHWLKAKGDPKYVKESLISWLCYSCFANSRVASFIYPNWLKAGGEKKIIEESLTRWLKKNDSIFDAQFIFTAWLDIKGEKSIVKQPLLNWLKKYNATEKKMWFLGYGLLRKL